MIEVTHLSTGHAIWGAYRAANRIHTAVAEDARVESQMWVLDKQVQDTRITQPIPRRYLKRRIQLAQVIGRVANALRRDEAVLHSPAMLPSNWSGRLTQSTTDIVHIHWICFEMASIEDIGRITTPIVWTLHDMWAFSGAAHTSEGEGWRTGYRGEGYRLFDLNRFVWNRKRRNWRRPMHIVCPSTWMAGCARESPLMRDWPVTVIANPIDTSIWAPREAREERVGLGLDPDGAYLLYGALSSTSDPRKGYALLQEALAQATFKGIRPQILVFGNAPDETPPVPGYEVTYFGHIKDDDRLSRLYAAADVMIVPSRLEPFGQTASEAMSCGTPVVAFGNTGLADIVRHGETGYLATAFDTRDLAKGISTLLAEMGGPRASEIRARARARVVETFASDVVGRQYADLYASILSGH
ncbi:MAG: glycosyltransferase [Pseudomonadota bacterium]